MSPSKRPCDNLVAASRHHDTTRIGAVALSFVLAGILGIISCQTGASALVLVWALSAGVLGAALGFLFGVPRAVATVRDHRAVGGTDAPPVTGLDINTNLEQVSDWVTKIVLGIGLVELTRVPSAIVRLAHWATAGTFAAAAAERVLVAALLYFGATGFLVGYLITRIHLSAAFRRADRKTRDIQFGSFRTSRDVIDQSAALIAPTSVRADPGSAPPDDRSSVYDREAWWVEARYEDHGLVLALLKRKGYAVKPFRDFDDACAELNHSGGGAGILLVLVPGTVDLAPEKRLLDLATEKRIPALVLSKPGTCTQVAEILGPSARVTADVRVILSEFL